MWPIGEADGLAGVFGYSLHVRSEVPELLHVGAVSSTAKKWTAVAPAAGS